MAQDERTGAGSVGARIGIGREWTEADRAQFRKEYLNEVGTESPCPFCQRPRVRRSTYTRCNPCGTNWLDEENTFPEYLDQNPAVSRYARLMGKPKDGTGKSKAGGASPAGSGTGEQP